MGEKKIKVLHVSYSKVVPSGVFNQLLSEIEATKKYKVDWDTVLFTTSDKTDEFVISINNRWPTPLQILFVYFWIFRKRKDYDIILLRNIKADLIGWLIIPFINNIITIHHTKEIEECSGVLPVWYGNILSGMEYFFGKLKLKNVSGIAAVTNEIVEYEKNRINRNIKSLVIPNGLNTFEYSSLDNRDKELNQAIFISSSFEPWHGLEKLLANLVKNQISGFVLHIVGQLNDQQGIMIDKINNGNKVICHGYLSKDEIKDLLAKVDIGLSSFAMEKNSLSEASTLKVREYLNNGLPVYSGHRDSGLPEDFEFYRIGEPTVEGIIKYIEEIKGSSRVKVRERATQYIDKGAILKRAYSELVNKFG